MVAAWQAPLSVHEPTQIAVHPACALRDDELLALLPSTSVTMVVGYTERDDEPR